MNSQDDPQACTKCGSMPEDILMLACSHDLCLNCAADRLAFQMKKNKNTNFIVCQQCHQKTPLDAESINVLKSLIKPSIAQTRAYQPNPSVNSSKYAEPNNYERSSRNQPQKQDKYNYERGASLNGNSGIDKSAYDRTDRNNINLTNPTKSKVGSLDAFQGISSKKTCTQHQEEQILYFCFDCKCECICPECIIHGKHKDHDVKTIRKSQPLIKSQADKLVQKMTQNVETLLIKKSQIEKQIRTLTEQNSMSKRQIQQAFDDLRSKISQQQKQVLLKCDQNLSDNLTELDKASKKIVKIIDQLKLSSATMAQATRKQQILFLNFYSRKHKQMQNQAKDPQILIPFTQLSSNQPILSSILDVSDQVIRSTTTSKPIKN